MSEQHNGTVPTKAVLVRALSEGYKGRAWHGPSVRSVLRGIDYETASFRLDPARNSIWEIVLHLAYTRHRSVLRLAKATGAKAERFPRPLRKSWWPEAAAGQSTSAWKDDKELLEQYQQRLLETIEAVPDEVLTRSRSNKKRPLGSEILGVAVHDAYHAGQIRLIALAIGSSRDH